MFYIFFAFNYPKTPMALKTTTKPAIYLKNSTFYQKSHTIKKTETILK